MNEPTFKEILLRDDIRRDFGPAMPALRARLLAGRGDDLQEAADWLRELRLEANDPAPEAVKISHRETATR